MADEAEGTLNGPGGKGFYGAVTVSERGQISLPAQARRDLGISPGDKLLVLGDPEQGLALMTVDRLLGNMDFSPVLRSAVRERMGREDPEAGTAPDPEPGS